MVGRAEYARRMNLALRFVEQHYREDIGLKEIANAAFFSPYHFHRIFSGIQGETPVEYLRRIRLEKAAVHLAIRPEQTITQIALENGFSSSSVFARAFLDRFGVPAGMYRRRFRGRVVADRTRANGQGEPRGRAKRDPVRRPGARYAFVRMRDMPALRLACVRSMSGYGPSIEKAWRALFAWGYGRGVIGPDTRTYGIPLDDPEVTPKKKCRYLAALSVGPNVVPDAPAEIVLVEPCWRAEFFFRSSLTDITQFYDWVYGVWLPRSGFLPDDKLALEEYAPGTPVPASDSAGDRVLAFSFLLSVRSL